MDREILFRGKRADNPTAVIRWFEKYQNTEWYKLAETSFDSLLRMIADNSDKLSG